MGVSAAREELLGQRDGRNIGASWLERRVQRARTRRQNLRAAKWLLNADARRTREHKLAVLFALAAKRIISRILCQNPAEVRRQARLRSIRSRTEETGGEESIERE